MVTLPALRLPARPFSSLVRGSTLSPGRRCAGQQGDAMSGNPNIRRMTLRQLLTSAEKCSRDLAEQLNTTLLTRVTDARDLSRPVRRRSHYPTLIALVNSLNKLQQADEEIEALVEYLLEQMEAIREAARKERFRR